MQVIAPKGNPTKLSISAFGVTQPSSIDSENQFSSLPAVNDELNAVAKLFPDSNIYKDLEFTQAQLTKELQTELPRVLHLATHTRFGFDSDKTYLVTGEKESTSIEQTLSHRLLSTSLAGISQTEVAQTSKDSALNKTLSINELYRIIRDTHQVNHPIDLLLLTGCETAAGSEREALGIAGITLQAGVKSTMATLWQVEDQASSELVSSFYQYLKVGLPKATALQKAQLDWLKENPQGKLSHAGYWASFMLIGNWQ